MNRYNQLFQEIFKQPLSHEGNTGLLEKTIADYPYFTPAHFFLLHLTDRSSTAFTEQAKKTALLFNNNYWLNFQLLELNLIASQQEPESKAVVTNTEPATEPSMHPQIPASYNGNAVEAVQTIGNTFTELAVEKADQPQSTATVKSEVGADESLPAEEMVQQSFGEDISSEATPLKESVAENEFVNAGGLKGFINDQLPGEDRTEQSFAEDFSNGTAPVSTAIPEVIEEQAAEEPALNTFDEQEVFIEPVTPSAGETSSFEESQEVIPDEAFTKGEMVADAVTNGSSHAEVFPNERGSTETLSNDEVPVYSEPTTTSDTFKAEQLPTYTDAEMAENEAAYNETDLLEDDGEDAGMDHVSLKMAGTLAGINLDKNTTEDTISFEPLHASDYFASVGIRLSDELKPVDKLGLQLKSFTEWLKTMKKMHAEQLADTSSSDNNQEKNDKKIQELAEASNKQNEVLTEAMADVFQQQGKTGKAIEVYEKLSLLDPSKKVYFAAKIKQLNN